MGEFVVDVLEITFSIDALPTLTELINLVSFPTF